jgi:ABC-type antimicrobial peptide transport system permease subunit
VSYYQFPQRGATLVVRSASRDPLAVGGEVKARLASIDPAVAISGIRRVSDQLAASYGDRQVLSRLLEMFAMLALGLTIVGIGSVVSFAVVQRTREIGIRMALGAPASGVMRLVIRGVLAPVTCGAIVGVGLLTGLSGVARSYVFGVSPLDPASVVISLAVLFVAAVSAAYFPARRAAAVDPMRAMRR